MSSSFANAPNPNTYSRGADTAQDVQDADATPNDDRPQPEHGSCPSSVANASSTQDHAVATDRDIPTVSTEVVQSGLEPSLPGANTGVKLDTESDAERVGITLNVQPPSTRGSLWPSPCPSPRSDSGMAGGDGRVDDFGSGDLDAGPQGQSQNHVPDVGDDTDFLQTLSAENGPVTSSSSIYGAFGDRPARDVVPPSSYGGKSASRANTGPNGFSHDEDDDDDADLFRARSPPNPNLYARN